MKRKKRKRRWENYYLVRDESLFELGFTSYKEYLKSELWRGIREKKLKKHPNCFGCGKAATQVHHRSYSRWTLEGKQLHQLVSVCGDCHRQCEYDDNGRKLVHITTINSRIARIRQLNIESGKISRSEKSKRGKGRGRQTPVEREELSKKVFFQLLETYPGLTRRRASQIAVMPLRGQKRAITALARNRRRKQKRKEKHQNEEG